MMFRRGGRRVVVVGWVVALPPLAII